ALRDSGCGAPGLHFVFRARAAFPANDAVPAVYLAGECDRARYEFGESERVVAAVVGIFRSARWRGRAHSWTGYRPTSEIEKGASISVLAEIAQTICFDKGSWRGDGVLRGQGDSSDRGAGGYGSAELVVRELKPPISLRLP